MSKKTVSYSQLSMFSECQYKWYLTYVKDMSRDVLNIHLVFGSAMHTVLQKYLTQMYNTTVKDADNMDVYVMLKTCLTEEFLKAKEKMNGIPPATKEELVEFYNDGVAILDFFKKHRADYFNRKGYSLVGVEVPVRKDLHNNVTFSGYLDVVIKDDISGKIKIVDFKTSTNGWRDYAKKDAVKTSQIVLYKKFYSELFDVPLDKIDVEFLILKRKLYENTDFPQKRLQKFSPASGKVTVKQTETLLNEFIETCFTKDGEFNENREYEKATNPKKCDWCDYLGKNCPGAKK